MAHITPAAQFFMVPALHMAWVGLPLALFENTSTFILILYGLAAAAVLFIGYRAGRWIGELNASKIIAQKEQDLFTAQKGFKGLYEQELATVKSDNEKLREQVKTLTGKVEDYRKKAAGYGGLFSSNNKRADAMYALLLENEALEEALYSQNEKLRQERTDQLKETLRTTGYRRTLITQLMNDDRIKGAVQEILAEEMRLPSAGDGGPQRALPEHRPNRPEPAEQGGLEGESP